MFGEDILFAPVMRKGQRKCKYKGFISDVTDKIMPQIEDWQNRPLSEVYPVLYIDAIHYSVRDNGVIRCQFSDNAILPHRKMETLCYYFIVIIVS